MKKETVIWLNLAKEDYDDGLYLFNGGRYPNAIYHLCQAIEKALKGARIECLDQTAPHTHNLESLAKKSGLVPSEDKLLTLRELFTHFKRVRYGDLAQKYYNTKRKVEPIIKIAETLYLWILKELKDQSKHS